MDGLPARAVALAQVSLVNDPCPARPAACRYDALNGTDASRSTTASMKSARVRIPSAPAGDVARGRSGRVRARATSTDQATKRMFDMQLVNVGEIQPRFAGGRRQHRANVVGRRSPNRVRTRKRVPGTDPQVPEGERGAIYTGRGWKPTPAGGRPRLASGEGVAFERAGDGGGYLLLGSGDVVRMTSFPGWSAKRRVGDRATEGGRWNNAVSETGVRWRAKRRESKPTGD